MRRRSGLQLSVAPKVQIGPPPLNPDDFEVQRELAAAESGVSVRVLQNMRTRRLVVEKQFSSDTAVGEAAPRFIREAELLRSHPHPRIIQLVGVFMPRKDRSQGSLILEYADRGSLRDVLPQLAALQIYQVLLDVVEALAFLHGRDVVHGNLKPENILIDGESRAKLTDFGSARGASLETSGTVDQRSQAYAAPELGVVGGSATKAGDVFSLGLIIHEAVVFQEGGGGRVHTLPAPSAQTQLLGGQAVDLENCRNEVLKALMQRCLVLGPQGRETIDGVRMTLDELLAPLAIGVPEPPPPPPVEEEEAPEPPPVKRKAKRLNVVHISGGNIGELAFW